MLFLSLPTRESRKSASKTGGRGYSGSIYLYQPRFRGGLQANSFYGSPDFAPSAR